MLVCLFVCVLDNTKDDEQIFLNFFMCVGLEERKTCLNFGKDLDHILDAKTYRILKDPIFNVF